MKTEADIRAKIQELADVYPSGDSTRDAMITFAVGLLGWVLEDEK